MAVRPRFAGRQVRCPFCHTLITVPRESRQSHAGEEYPLMDWGENADPASAPPTIAIACSLCGTRLYGTHVGQSLTCPDCGTVQVVSLPKGAPQPPPVAAGPREDYPIYGPDQPPPEVRAVHRRYVPVVCSLCHTRMMAVEEQVGQTLTCPDCGTPNPVVMPQERAELERESPGEYGLDAPPVQAEYYAYKCPTCLTRLHARADEAGQKAICPDCRRELVIPAAPARPAQAAADVAEAIPSRGPAKRPAMLIPGFKPLEDGGKLERLEENEEDDEPQRPRIVKRRIRDQKARMPRWPMVSGVFAFPFHGEGAFYWAVLSTALCLLASGFGMAVYFTYQGGSLLLPAVLMFALMGVAAGMWFVFTSLSMISIIQDTASGNDRVESWPHGDWIDRLWEPLFVVNSWLLSGAAGIFVGRVLISLGLPFQPGIVIGWWLGFPLLMLSYLETGQLLNPVSTPVWQSLVDHWKSWAVFYLLSALLAVAMAAVSLAWHAALVRFGLTGLIAALAGVLWCVVAASMIYARLMGRLGWTIGAADA